MATTKAESSSVASPSVMRGQSNSAAATIGPELAERLELLREIRPGAVRLAFSATNDPEYADVHASYADGGDRHGHDAEPVSDFRISGVRGGVLA